MLERVYDKRFYRGNRKRTGITAKLIEKVSTMAVAQKR